MLLTNPQQIKTVRYAVGLTIAIALAFGIAWPLSFLFPVVSAVMLALPLPKPTLSQGLHNMLNTLFAFGVGYALTLFILPLTVIFIPILGLLLFHTYYHLNRGGSFWLVLMLIINLLLMPMLAGVNEGLAIGVVYGLVFSSGLTISLLWLAHYLVPDLPDGPAMPAPAGYQSGYSAPAAEAALKSTVVVLPIVIIFLANNWTGQILVMIFVAIFSLSPNLNKGKESGKNSIISTIIGGAVAFFVYWALVAVPEYYFFVLIMFLLSLRFGAVIYSGAGMAKYLSSAMTTVILLVNSSLTEGEDFSENFVMRVVLILLATVYVVLALRVLDAFWPKQNFVVNQSTVSC